MKQIDWNNIDAGEFTHEKNHKLQNIPINGALNCRKVKKKRSRGRKVSITK